MTVEFDLLYDSLTSEGWLSKPEARLLLSSARLTDGTLVEVGSYCGRSAMLLASLGRPLVCVDPFAGFNPDDPSGEYAKGQFLKHTAGFPNVKLEQMRVEDWQPVPAGFVYLDGDHTGEGTAAQIRAALACGPKMVAVHDVGEQGDGLVIKQVCLDLLGPWACRGERLAVWVVQPWK